MSIRNPQHLIDFIAQGNQVKYVFFWGHRRPKTGVCQTCLSQWYEAGFDVGGVRYPTAEHYMMAQKARLFGDEAVAEKIVGARHPGEAKKLGRMVAGFDGAVWNAQRFDIVVAGNLAKFGQNRELGEFLLNTHNRVLVEASPVDKIWGIGLAGDDPAAEDPSRWQGLNLLGFALMEVRDRLAGGEG